MAKRKRKLKLTPNVDKYSLGDFVTQNQEIASDYQNRIASIPQVQNNTMNSVSSMASLGAGLGSVIPGLGTGVGAAIGTGLGALGGLIFGSSANRNAERQRTNAVNKLNKERSNITQDLYNGSIDTTNNNPYGIYADGGQVIPEALINIEKGELQIDPDSGDILRKFIGYNPESGGLYENHNDKGKDTLNNYVTAKEGTFIITKAKAKEYEDTIKNNDKIKQNTILKNIQNNKRRKSLTEKYEYGGEILPWMINPYAQSTQLNPIYYTANSGINTPTVNNVAANVPNSESPFNKVGNILNSALGLTSGIFNITQGLSAPKYQEARPVRLDIENRQKILSEMPEELSDNPAINRIRNARTSAGINIDRTTSNPAISRMNKLGLESGFIDAENQALYDNEIRNNQIKSQRASILGNLSEQDMRRTAGNIDNLNQVDEINRQLDLAKRQQLNTGVSQIIQNFRNNQMIKQQKSNDSLRLQMLKDMNPYISTYMDNWEKYLR